MSVSFIYVYHYAYIKPSQPTARNPPNSMFTSAALLHPVQGQDPLLRFYSTKVILLTMQIGCDITAHEGEECGNRKCFIAIANDAVVDCVFVKEHTEPGDEGVDRNHQ